MTETKNIKSILEYLDLTINAIEIDDFDKANKYFQDLMDGSLITREIYDNYDNITDALASVSSYLERHNLGFNNQFYGPGYLRLGYRELQNEVREKELGTIKI